jgi:hypothetical protein
MKNEHSRLRVARTAPSNFEARTQAKFYPDYPVCKAAILS